jgi:hypothetical protein
LQSVLCLCIYTVPHVADDHCQLSDPQPWVHCLHLIEHLRSVQQKRWKSLLWRFRLC